MRTEKNRHLRGPKEMEYARHYRRIFLVDRRCLGRLAQRYRLRSQLVKICFGAEPTRLGWLPRQYGELFIKLGQKCIDNLSILHITRNVYR